MSARFYLGVGFACLLCVAGFIGGYSLSNHRASGRIAALESERDLAVAASTDYRGQLSRAGELAGQLGDGLADAVARAAKATGYRAGAQIYIDAIRDTLRGLGVLSGLGAVENTEPAEMAGSE